MDREVCKNLLVLRPTRLYIKNEVFKATHFYTLWLKDPLRLSGASATTCPEVA